MKALNDPGESEAEFTAADPRSQDPGRDELRRLRRNTNNGISRRNQPDKERNYHGQNAGSSV